MTIKEAIERGLYPKDEKGRALVPGDDGSTWVVLCTDRNMQEHPIVAFRKGDGQISSFPVETSAQRGLIYHLLPPAPRKVEVKRWAIVRTSDRSIVGTWDTETDAAIARDNADEPARRRVVLLTGSYEEPWS